MKLEARDRGMAYREDYPNGIYEAAAEADYKGVYDIVVRSKQLR